MKPIFKERTPRLTGRIRKEEASTCRGEVAIVEQLPERGANVCAHVVRRRSDITHDLRTAIEDGNDALEVMARDEVLVSASVKRLQFGGDEQSRRDDSYVVPSGSSVTPRTSPFPSGHTGGRSPCSAARSLSGGAACAPASANPLPDFDDGGPTAPAVELVPY